MKLARNVLSAKVNGSIQDATRPINDDAEIQFFTWNDTDGKAAMWHSSAHLMAEALEALYPGIKFGIGPPVETGFYYDVDFGEQEFDSIAHQLMVVDDQYANWRHVIHFRLSLPTLP